MTERLLANIVFPDPQDPTAGILEICACRLGCYLTAGRARVRIPVNYGAELDTVLSEILSTAHTDPAEVEIGGELWVIDSSLKEEVAVALLTMIAQVELSESDLSLYPPTDADEESEEDR